MSNDGGPAFPEIRTDVERTGDNVPVPYVSSAGGMTLRDYFAAKALTGIVADPNVRGEPSDFARASYLIADAMLAERGKDGAK